MTSQIFANVYLHELDRFVKHTLRIRGYLRYGDDFVLFERNAHVLMNARAEVLRFLQDRLALTPHDRNDILLPCSCGMLFLGYEIFPGSRKLRRRTWRKMLRSLEPGNLASYRGLVVSEQKRQSIRQFCWHLLQSDYGLT